MERKKKLRLAQLSFLIIGVLVIFFTYSHKKEDYLKEGFISKESQEIIKNQKTKQSVDGDLFFNIEYSGLDLAGNRYILKSKEAYNNKENQEFVNMKFVEAAFYFKDGTALYVWSDQGLYNNKTLDMKFTNNVKAIYEGSELFAQKADYSNSKGFLTITEKVRINDVRGNIVADKLLFDIKKETLNIAAFKNNKISANVNLK